MCVAILLFISQVFAIQYVASYPQGDYVLAFIPVEDYSYVLSATAQSSPVTYELQLGGVYMEALPYSQSFGTVTATAVVSTPTEYSSCYSCYQPTVVQEPVVSIVQPITPIVEYIAPAPVPVTEYIAPVPEYIAPVPTGPTYLAPAPTYVAPAPTYVAPAPTYVAPAPTYIAPTPAPAPVEINEVVNVAVSQNIEVDAIDSNVSVGEALAGSLDALPALESSPVYVPAAVPVASQILPSASSILPVATQAPSMPFGGLVPASGSVKIFASFC